MKSRVLLDFMLIFAVYILYTVVNLLVTGWTPGDGISDENEFSLVLVGVSLLCALAWYVLGEWGIRSYASLATWYGLWFLLLMVVLITGGVMVFLYKVNPIVLVGAGVFYYLATMLFSPFHAKFLIWPSKHIRSW